MHPTHCPNCRINWYSNETIYEYFLRRGETPKRATEISAMYGCTPEHPKHFGENIVGIEIQGKYDGVSQWQCTNCNTIFDRWSMEPIKE